MLSKLSSKQFPTRRKMNLNLSKWRSISKFCQFKCLANIFNHKQLFIPNDNQMKHSNIQTKRRHIPIIGTSFLSSRRMTALRSDLSIWEKDHVANLQYQYPCLC